MDLHCLIANLLQNIKDWVTIVSKYSKFKKFSDFQFCYIKFTDLLFVSKMPELCFAMSELSNHHHNFLKLLQLVPTFEIRGR